MVFVQVPDGLRNQGLLRNLMDVEMSKNGLAGFRRSFRCLLLLRPRHLCLRFGHTAFCLQYGRNEVSVQRLSFQLENLSQFTLVVVTHSYIPFGSLTNDLNVAFESRRF